MCANKILGSQGEVYNLTPRENRVKHEGLGKTNYTCNEFGEVYRFTQLLGSTSITASEISSIAVQAEPLWLIPISAIVKLFFIVSGVHQDCFLQIQK